MSENLKRAESLFNRIMNQNKPGETKSAPQGNSHRHSQNENRGHRLLYRRGRDNNLKNSEHHGNGNRHEHHKEEALASIDLPKRDPVKEAQAAVAKVPQDHHVLPYCWTVWHHLRLKVKPEETEADKDNTSSASAAVDSYLQTTNEIEFRDVANPDETTKTIASVEQLWGSLSQTKRAFELHHSTQLLIFKTGINPVWEDPINAKGGRWVFRFGRRSHPGHTDKDPEMSARVRQRTSMIWERLVLRTLTGSLIPDKQYLKHVQEQLLSDISGLALSIRRDEDIVSLWNSNLHFGRRRGDDEDKKPLQPFQARRIMCDAILRVIRECDLILQGSDCVETTATGSTERVAGVSFEYRLHAESNSTTMYWDRMRRRNHHKDEPREEEAVA